MMSVFQLCIFSEMLCKDTKFSPVLQIIRSIICDLTFHFCSKWYHVKSRVSDSHPKREGDVRENESPSRASPPFYKGFPNEKGRKGGTSADSSNIRDDFIDSSQFFYRRLAFRPIIDNCQSVGFGLAVRKVRTHSPTGTSSLNHYLFATKDIDAFRSGPTCKFPTTQVVPYIHLTSYTSHRFDTRRLCVVNPLEIVEEIGS